MNWSDAYWAFALFCVGWVVGSAIFSVAKWFHENVLNEIERANDGVHQAQEYNLTQWSAGYQREAHMKARVDRLETAVFTPRRRKGDKKPRA